MHIEAGRVERKERGKLVAQIELKAASNLLHNQIILESISQRISERAEKNAKRNVDF